MATLTTLQSLKDSANLASNLVFPGRLSKLNLTASNTAWIYYGGSYAGAKAAFARKLFPDVFWGAIASSGVTTAIVDFWQYYEVSPAATPPPLRPTSSPIIAMPRSKLTTSPNRNSQSVAQLQRNASNRSSPTQRQSTRSSNCTTPSSRHLSKISSDCEMLRVMLISSMRWLFRSDRGRDVIGMRRSGVRCLMGIVRRLRRIGGISIRRMERGWMRGSMETLRSGRRYSRAIHETGWSNTPATSPKTSLHYVPKEWRRTIVSAAK